MIWRWFKGLPLLGKAVVIIIVAGLIVWIGKDPGGAGSTMRHTWGPKIGGFFSGVADFFTHLAG